MFAVCREKKTWGRFLLGLAKCVLVFILWGTSMVVTVILAKNMAYGSGNPESSSRFTGADAAIMDKFDMRMNNAISEALDGVLSIEKVYWLSDGDLIAPEPDPSRFGRTDDPSSLGWLLEEAQGILKGQELVFSTETQIHPNSEVIYYLDESILAITWKQNYDSAVYTVSEVKVAHPSQFRRFLAGGEYGSSKKYITTDMAAMVNAVVASSGDFYSFGGRRLGIMVYNGVVEHANGEDIDSCMIDDNGDLILIKHGEITDTEAAQKFVDEHDVRFSVCFGPILIRDGERILTDKYYPVGQGRDSYARAAVCQKDELHYFLVTANGEDGGYWNRPNNQTFTDFVETFGLQQAYMLDGGQTAVIVMNDELINNVEYGAQRKTSDIIYFATAVPEE